MIESLTYIQHYYSEQFELWVNIKDISDAQQTELYSIFNKKLTELQLLVYKSGFIIDGGVAEILNNLLVKANCISNNENIVEHFDEMYGLTRDTIYAIREIAKKDLKIK